MSHGHIVLHLSDRALSIYLVTRHGNTLMGQAPPGEPAYSLLQACIAERPRACFHLLLDLADEDFRCEAIPALTGADRREFLARKLDQYYPHATLRHSRLLRNPDKTASQQALLSAIGATQEIDRLLACLEQAQCVLRGVYSLALAMHDLYSNMGYLPDCRVLISKNAHDLIRQSYFSTQGLRLSRMLPVCDISPSSLASHTRQLHQYLLSINAITREQTLQVHLLWEEAITPEFTLAYHTVLQAESLPIVVHTASEPGNIGSGLEAKLMSAMVRGQIKNHYGSAMLRRHFLLRKMQQSMQAASILLIALGLLLAGTQYSALDEQQQLMATMARQIQKETEQQHLIQAQIKRIPASERPEDIALYRAHLAHWPDIEPSAQHISQILLDCPVLLIDAFSWQAHGAPTTSTPTALPVAAVTARTQHWQTITLNGQITPANDDYRRLSADIDQCMTALASLPHSTVHAKKMPLDLRPQARITRQGQEPPDETFSLQIVLAPTDETVP